MKNVVHLIDNMEFMAGVPDNAFDLAIVDPEYGIGISKNPFRQAHKKKDWDNKIPSTKYFKDLIRISKNQIIWGGNYFCLKPSQGFIIWDKKQAFDFSSSMCEYAWISEQRPAKMFRYKVTNEKHKIHPTQKPIALYKWLLANYAKPGQTIFDSHVGSGSIRIACYDMGFDFTGCEKDPDYWQAQEDRYQEHIRKGPELFDHDEYQDLTYHQNSFTIQK